MLDILRANKKLMNRIEDAVMCGRTAFSDLTEIEAENIVEACIESLNQQQVAEIIANGFDDTDVCSLLAELSKAKTRLCREDAMIEVNKELNRFYVNFFEDYIHTLLGEKAAEIREEQKFVNHFLDRDVFNVNPFKLIQSASTFI